MKVGTIIFSKDRAMQLTACLESMLKLCEDPENLDIHVLYKTSTPEHQQSYEIVKKEYPAIDFVKEVSFKQDLLQIVNSHKIYILFACDDIIVSESYKISDILTEIDKKNEYLVFSLRLGENTNYCYSLGMSQGIPEWIGSISDVRVWDWRKEKGDWGYPLEVSFSLYKLKDIMNLLSYGEYDNPNSLEAMLYSKLGNFVEASPYMLCYKKSIAFSLPINLVQIYNNNRSGHNIEYSSDSLLEKYLNGERIDVDVFKGHNNISAHSEEKIVFKSI